MVVSVTQDENEGRSTTLAAHPERQSRGESGVARASSAPAHTLMCTAASISRSCTETSPPPCMELSRARCIVCPTQARGASQHATP